MYRILVIGFPSGFNGIATTIRNLYPLLDKNLFQWDFLMPEYLREKAHADMKSFQRHGANIYYLEHSPSEFPSESLNKLRDLLISKPDICGVYVHDYAFNIDPLLVADDLGLPIKIIHSHAPANDQSIAELDLSARQRDNISSIGNDSFIRLACSPYSGQYSFPGLDYSLFPNAVDVKKHSYKPIYRQIVRKKMKIPENAQVLGFVGTHDERKNPLFALRVFEEYHRLVPSSHMIITGNGPMLDELRAYSDQAGLSSYTHFIGFQKEVDIFFSGMDLLLFPSMAEGLPYALVEAQTSGLPCLVSDTITDMICLTPLITMRSLQDTPFLWAKEAQSIILSSGLRSSWAKEITDAGFDIRESIQKLEDIFLHCLNRDNQYNNRL